MSEAPLQANARIVMACSSDATDGGLEEVLRRCVEEVEAKKRAVQPSCPLLECPSSSRNGGPSLIERRPAVKARGHRQGTTSATTPKQQQQKRRSNKGNIKPIHANKANFSDLVFLYTSNQASPAEKLTSPSAPADVVMQPSNPLTSPNPHSYWSFPTASPLAPLKNSNSSILAWESPSEPACVSRSQPVSPKNHVNHNPTRPFTSQPASPLSQSTSSPCSPLNGAYLSSFHLVSSAETRPQNPLHLSYNEAHGHSYLTSGAYPQHAYQDTGSPVVATACLDETQKTNQASSLAFLETFLMGH